MKLKLEKAAWRGSLIKERLSGHSLINNYETWISLNSYNIHDLKTADSVAASPVCS